MGSKRKPRLSSTSRVNTVLSPKPVVAETTAETKIIYIRALYDSIIKYAGQETGKPYVWNGAGSVVGVAEEDAPFLLSKVIGNRSCCGGSGQEGNRVFEEYKESQ